MRFRLRTLLIVLALGPVVLAGGYFLVTRDSSPLGFALSLAVATVTVPLMFVLPLLVLDWLLKRTRR